MYGEHHDLVHEFPEYKDKIHEMKMNNHHFARLFDEYHEVNKEVVRMEQAIETVEDSVAEEMKLKRLHLKDELYSMLKA